MYAHICVYYLSVKPVKNDFIFTEPPAGRTWSVTEDINLMLIWFQSLEPPILCLPIRVSWSDTHRKHSQRRRPRVYMWSDAMPSFSRLYRDGPNKTKNTRATAATRTLQTEDADLRVADWTAVLLYDSFFLSNTKIPFIFTSFAVPFCSQ